MKIPEKLITDLTGMVVRRLGTALAAVLVASGIGDDLAVQIETGLVALAAVLVEFYLSYRSGRNLIRAK